MSVSAPGPRETAALSAVTCALWVAVVSRVVQLLQQVGTQLVERLDLFLEDRSTEKCIVNPTNNHEPAWVALCTLSPGNTKFLRKE